MEAKWLTRKNLILVLALLLSLKFALMPLIEWQSDRIDELAAKIRQLAKVDSVIQNKSFYLSELEALRASVEKNSSYIYRDSDSTKLSVQQDLEEIFIQGGLEVTGFNWVLDSRESPESVRVLRGIVYFSGATSTMVKVFWNISSSSRLIRIVDWRQQIQRYGPDIFGMTSGNVTLEFFASDKYYRASDDDTEITDG